ncbi:hypothetical protein LF1_05140 [Rubripirellula obstinata]|uniref:Uncharacterized protein n=1 Tax=Rubripirellula obstinata TaxID=406547 RepID=A0A5B1CEY4_9BACT|nr:hypothetical protein [Rubripirellula obstinata]KAA1258023.1 hypothetical protein LF1_05140 [Rubripirellula obstinata]
MNDFDEFAHFFRKPKYPVIVDIEGVLVAAKSVRPLCTKLLRLDLVEKQSYDAIDKTGESWTLVVMRGNAVLSPINFKKQPTKLELIRWFNNRKNKTADEVEYSEKSLSSKKRDRIIAEIADRLLDAEKRNASSGAKAIGNEGEH